MMALNLWLLPITVPYLGAIMILVFMGLSLANNEAWHELDDMYLMDISGFDNSRIDQ